MSLRGMLWMAVVGGGLAGGWLQAPAEEQPNEDAVRAFMRGKLDAAEAVLEGLVTEDFELIQRGADQLRVMGQRAEWNVLKTREYVQYSAEFQRVSEQLGSAGKEKKLDAASLAYLQLTMTCINCHKHARGAKIARLEADWSIAEAAVAWGGRS